MIEIFESVCNITQNVKENQAIFVLISLKINLSDRIGSKTKAAGFSKVERFISFYSLELMFFRDS